MEIFDISRILTEKSCKDTYDLHIPNINTCISRIEHFVNIEAIAEKNNSLDKFQELWDSFEL